MEVMEISPRAQAQMLLMAAIVGVAAGMVFDLLGVFRSTLGGGGARPDYYDRALPLIGPLRDGALRRVTSVFLLTAADILFPIAWAAAMLCVFFIADDGIFRISGILSGAAGFVLWRKTIGIPFRACGSFIVYILRAAAAYACFPAVFAARMLRRAVKKVSAVVARAAFERKIRRYDARERERLYRSAENGFDLMNNLGSSDSKK